MAEKEALVGAEELTRFTQDVFVQVGLPPEDAATEAEVLVWANLRGVDSHGVLRIPSYVSNAEQGIMNPRPDIQVAKETPATILIDGDRAFGPVVTKFAMHRVMEKARQVGIGWGLIRETTHQGAMAYYALMAAEEDMAGIASVCSPPNMAPHGAKVAGVHNSPIAIAVPGRRNGHLVLDMATSVAAGGKIKLAVDKGTPIPAGWALNENGDPTVDPKEATILMPFGGPKGSGLALMFECLASLMVGNPLLKAVAPGEERRSIWIQNSFVAAIDIGTFTDVEGYKTDADDTVDTLKALPRAEGTDEILVPGEPENRVLQKRKRDGIPLPGGTVKNLRTVARKLGVRLPEGI